METLSEEDRATATGNMHKNGEFQRLEVHDDMNFKVIRGQGQGQEMTSVPYLSYASRQTYKQTYRQTHRQTYSS